MSATSLSTIAAQSDQPAALMLSIYAKERMMLTLSKRISRTAAIGATAVALSLAGCGGSSGGGETIDLSRYIIPPESATLNYSYYNVFDDGTEGPYPEAESWQVFETSAILSIGGDDDTFIGFSGSNIVVEGEDWEFSYPRRVRSGAMNSDSYGDRFIVFGPFETRQFAVLDIVDNDNEDVIVMVHRFDMGEDGADIEVSHYSLGTGRVGSLYYELCPANIPLSLTEDYLEQCGSFYSFEFLSSIN